MKSSARSSQPPSPGLFSQLGSLLVPVSHPCPVHSQSFSSSLSLLCQPADVISFPSLLENPKNWQNQGFAQPGFLDGKKLYFTHTDILISMLNFRVYKVWSLVFTFMQQGKKQPLIMKSLDNLAFAFSSFNNPLCLPQCFLPQLYFHDFGIPKGYFGKIIHLSRVSFLKLDHCLLLSRLPQCQSDVMEKNKNIQKKKVGFFMLNILQAAIGF